MSDKPSIIEGRAVTIHAKGTMVVVGSDQYFVSNSNQIAARDYLIEQLGLSKAISVKTNPSTLTSENIDQFLPTEHQYIYKLNS